MSSNDLNLDFVGAGLSTPSIFSKSVRSGETTDQPSPFEMGLNYLQTKRDLQLVQNIEPISVPAEINVALPIEDSHSRINFHDTYSKEIPISERLNLIHMSPSEVNRPQIDTVDFIKVFDTIIPAIIIYLSKGIMHTLELIAPRYQATYCNLIQRSVTSARSLSSAAFFELLFSALYVKRHPHILPEDVTRLFIRKDRSGSSAALAEHLISIEELLYIHRTCLKADTPRNVATQILNCILPERIRSLAKGSGISRTPADAISRVQIASDQYYQACAI